MWLLLRSLDEQAIPWARLLLSLSRRLRSRSCSRAACCLRPIFTSHQRSLHSTQCRHRGAFCARPSPRGRLFVDCRVQRVQFGGHGGPDRDRRDHRHIVMLTSMRSSSQPPSCSHAFLGALAQPSLLTRRLSLARWYALATSINRRCHQDDDTTGSRRVVRHPSRPWRFASAGIAVGAQIAAIVRRHDGPTGSPASFELAKLTTHVGGAANTSPLTRLVRELPFFFFFCRPRDRHDHTTVACCVRRPCARRSRDRRLVRSSSSRSSRRRDRHVVANVTSS